MKLYILIFPVILAAGFQMIFAQEEQKKKEDKSKDEFKLYLLPESVKPAELAKLDIKKIKPKDKPFLSTEDIWSYLKDTHEIALNYTAGGRLKNLKVPVSGRSFIVFVGNEPIYTGAFWTGFSSVSFRGVAVDVANLKGDFPVIKLELDYPPLAPKNVGFDPRGDARIFRTFEKAGRLFEQVWLKGKCQKIRATGKRRQSYVFTFAVTSIVKSTYESNEISFEIFDDVGDKILRRAIKAESTSNSYIEENWRIDQEQEILLKFERRVGGRDYEIYLRDFEIIE